MLEGTYTNERDALEDMAEVEIEQLKERN